MELSYDQACEEIQKQRRREAALVYRKRWLEKPGNLEKHRAYQKEYGQRLYVKERVAAARKRRREDPTYRDQEYKARRKYLNERYATDAAYREGVLVASAKRYQSRVALLLSYKEKNPCIRCGLNDPRCLEFHHRDPSQKSFCIGESMHRSAPKLLAEIKKCDILCANCHRIVEWELRSEKQSTTN